MKTLIPKIEHNWINRDLAYGPLLLASLKVGSEFNISTFTYSTLGCESWDFDARL
jgi:hypothetical protein